MKKGLFFLLLVFSVISKAQQLDGYNCIFLNSHTNNQWGLDDRIIESFTNKGFKVVTTMEEVPSTPSERLATLELTYKFEVRYGGTPFNFKLTNMLGNLIFEAEGVGNTISAKADANRACRRALGKMEKIPYQYDPSKTPKLPVPLTEKSSWSEKEIRSYLSSNDIDEIEGIYKNIGGSFFQFAILKDDGKYVAIVLKTDLPNWFIGNVKATFEMLRNKYYNATFFEDNYGKLETIAELDSNGVLRIGEHSFMQIFPIK